MAAIYQRARPATFAEVVGQDHVKEVLQAALRQGRASHAYLFSGPRGVGKTTTARLLAMALNCEGSKGGQVPCGACDSCRLVREGSHPDVMELDAASNNSVDDVRGLRERSTLASLRGGRRVWILDEAHMLSKSAANALLKTLEEPPPGLVFVLATTEPEKLPATVLSRCQHYRFRRLSEKEIEGKLERLCREAGSEAEPGALALVAKAADGAMRDAESLLERLLAPDAIITVAAVEDALGLPPLHRIQRLAGTLVEGRLAEMLIEAQDLYRDGFAPRSLVESLTEALQDGLRRQVVATAEDEEWRPGLDRSRLLRLIEVLDEEQERFIRRDDLYSLEIALIKGMNSVAGQGAPEPVPAQAPAATTQEMSAVRPGVTAAAAEGAGENGRTASASGGNGQEAVGREEPGLPGARQEEALPPFDPVGRSATATRAQRDVGRREAEARGTADAAGGRAAAATKGKFDWHAVRTAANAQLKAFLAPAKESLQGDVVVVSYGETHRFHFSQLIKRQEELAALIESVAGPGYRLRIEGPGEDGTKKR